MKGRDTRGHFAIRIDALQRLFMWHFLSGKIPLYLVTEYPKSGGSWMAQMLSAYCGIPFIRNLRPPFLSIRPCVLHGHHLYSPNFKNVFVVIRDGRDVMVSAYYHLLFHNDRNPAWAVEKYRKEVPFDNYESIIANLPSFIEYMVSTYARGLFRFSWSEFVLSWIDKDVPIIRYEDMLHDTVGTLYRAIRGGLGEDADVNKLRRIAGQFSFENLAKRKPGEENPESFLRKGVAGDWKRKFTKKACEVFDYYAGEVLIDLGYEQDRDWIRNWVTES